MDWRCSFCVLFGHDLLRALQCGNKPLQSGVEFFSDKSKNLPLFFVIYYNVDKKFCLESWPSVTSGKINSTFWLMVVGIIPAVIMISLYSRVVGNLWFKKRTSSSK